jgi:tRNA pseudouridine38-40 synthase
MAVYRIDLGYDGSRFHGYARQAGVRTVQGELEQALFRLTGPVETEVAGRTDKGVHAIGQVVSFPAPAGLDRDRVRRSLNRQLAPEIVVAAVGEAPEGFSARFSATGRSYRYLILNREVSDPFLARTSWHYETPLDLGAMSRAAAHLVGEQDYTSFCRKAGDRSLVRDVRRAMWGKGEEGLLAFEVEASSFCHQMVRSFVALCVEAGRGRVDPDDVPGIVAARDRHSAKGVAPPHGLTLVHVSYPSLL